MAAVDRSLVATLPMFAGLSPGEQDELLREAERIKAEGLYTLRLLKLAGAVE